MQKMKPLYLIFLLLLCSSSVFALKVISPYPICGNTGGSGGTILNGSYLNLNQSSSQVITDGMPIFSEGLITPIINDGSVNAIDTINAYLIFKGGEATAIDWAGSKAYDANGILRIEWGNDPVGRLSDSAGYYSINWEARELNDEYNTKSLNWKDRQLYDTSETSSIDYASRDLFDSGTYGSINWNDRLAFDTSGNYALDWANKLLFDYSGIYSLDWENRFAYDWDGNPSINWQDRKLQHSSGDYSIDWDARWLNDVFSVPSLDWANRQLLGSDGMTPMLDWSNSDYVDFMDKEIRTGLITGNGSGITELSPRYVQGNATLEINIVDVNISTTNYSLNFAGNKYIDLGTPASLELYKDFSVSLWAKPIKANSFIISKDFSTGARGWGMGMRLDGKFYLEVGGSSAIITSGGDISGVWRMLTFTTNGTLWKAYVDGVNFANATTPLLTANPNANTYINGREYVSFFQGNNGIYDEVLIFNRSLSDAEITQLYNTGNGTYANTSIAPFNSGLVSGYHFDEGSGTIAYDLTGRNNGTNTGATYTDGKVSHNISGTMEVIGDMGMIPYMTNNNYISTDTALKWFNNTLTNKFSNVSTLGSSTKKWNIYAQDIKFAGNISVSVCNTTNEGTIYYNAITKKHYGCNSTAWNSLY